MGTPSDPPFPKGIGAPAARALAAAGYTELRQLAGVPAAELARLHGMGPKALQCLRVALAEQGLRSADEPDRYVGDHGTRPSLMNRA